MKLFNEMEEGADLGGVAEPVSAPVSETPDSTDFAGLAQDDLHEDSGEPSTPPAAPEEKPAEAPVVAPVTPPEPEPIVALPPVTPPVEPVVTPPTPEVATQPEEGKPDFKTIRAAAEQELAEMYAFTEEGKEAYEMSPATELPKLAARLYLDLHEALFNGIAAQIPNIMRQQQEAASANAAGEREFYSLFPKLQDEKYKPTVVNIIKAYRQLNPTASREQLMRASGAMAHVTLGIPLEGEAATQPLTSPAPFQPAQPTGAPAPVATPQKLGMFEEFAVEDVALGNR